MIEDFISSAIASMLFSSLIVWLVRSWISERLRNAIRAEYDLRLETHKAQLKSASDITLERVRADLCIANAEHQIQFVRLHEQRAEVISETYARLTELYVALADYVKIFEPAGDKPKDERRQVVQKVHEHFITYYRTKRIFLPEMVVNIIESINEQSISAFYSFFYEVDMIEAQGENSGKRWFEIFKKVKDEMPKAIKELEREFRRLLGDKCEQPGEH